MPCSFAGQISSSYNTTPNRDDLGHATMALAPPTAYQSQPGPLSNAPTPGSVSDHAGDIQPTPIPISPHGFNHLDLELIHYYSTQTYMTMTSKLTAHLVWRDVIFKEALKHNFLLHALMATAALHKATNHAEDSEIHVSYVKTAFQYQNAALSGYIPALNHPTEDNAIALFTLSALLTIWLFGSKRLPEAMSNVNLNTASNLLPQMLQIQPSDHESTDSLEILTRVQGINAVVKQTLQWLTGGILAPLLQPPGEHELPPNPPELMASFQRLRARIASMTPSNMGLPESTVREQQDLYTERLDRLIGVARVRTVLQADQHLFSWPVSCEPAYVDLVRRKEAVALALFVHWAACFRCMDHLWWAKGWSFRLVKEASSFMSSSWADVLAWPCKEVGLDK